MSTHAVGAVPEFTVSDRLRKAREFAGLEQAQLAAVLGVSRNTVSNNESGRVQARTLLIRAWSMATGVSAEWIQSGRVPGDDGPEGQWAPWGSNPQPTDKGYAQVSALRGVA